MGLYTALTTFIGFTLLSAHAYRLQHGFLCSTSFVCALTGWMAHRDSTDPYWNTFDIWMVQCIAVANFILTAYLLDITNPIHMSTFIVLCIGGILVALRFSYLQKNNWNEYDHIV